MTINVVFSGGGIKGLTYIGALRYLELADLRIAYAGGSSIGALFASLVLAGFTSFELLDILNDFDIEILTTRHRKLSHILNVGEYITTKGIYKMDAFEDFVSNTLASKNIYTFNDLKENHKYTLKVVVTDMTNLETIVLPDDLVKYNINPDTFSVARAVAMCCNIPIFYKPYRLNNSLIVDGGVSCNFPIWLFDDNHFQTIGFNLEEKNPSQKKIFKGLKKFTAGIQKFIFPNKYFDNENNIVIPIKTNNLKSIDFAKGFEKREELYTLGFLQTKDYLAQY